MNKYEQLQNLNFQNIKNERVDLLQFTPYTTEYVQQILEDSKHKSNSLETVQQLHQKEKVNAASQLHGYIHTEFFKHFTIPTHSCSLSGRFDNIYSFKYLQDEDVLSFFEGKGIPYEVIKNHKNLYQKIRDIVSKNGQDDDVSISIGGEEKALKKWGNTFIYEVHIDKNKKIVSFCEKNFGVHQIDIDISDFSDESIAEWEIFKTDPDKYIRDNKDYLYSASENVEFYDYWWSELSECIEDYIYFGGTKYFIAEGLEKVKNKRENNI